MKVFGKGPAGMIDMEVTSGAPFDIYLRGVALNPHGDRIRIIPDTIKCGDEDSVHMEDSVMDLTSPLGKPADSTTEWQIWRKVVVNRLGYYKICWCAASISAEHNCDHGKHFSMHVARLIANGVMISIAGTGYPENIPNKYGEYLGFKEGTNSSDATVNYPQAMITSPVVDKSNTHQL